ncbi:bifunctional 2-polyprenyl-6-hydroxyphenol methylase/3-demethylubiquinol 3-O-methyltransferase UbiG [Synechococcus sp. CCY 9618]|uniref:class I SAM-dependent methyltransferase n=1 Tax=Synechococcus sp. CCY 9618 TaxID=2815602 RepID=UPI001C241ECF|nr:methyltransferase domain-containing protein [Synechococcus sp. CCY 9618]
MLLPPDAADDAAALVRPSLPGPEEQILSSWIGNAAAWTRAVRRGEIASRERVTNRAILEAIAHCAPRSLLDLGCGEGWLAHHCAHQGMVVVGIDAVAGLTGIAAAGAPAGASFRTLTYQEIAAGSLTERFDVAVANFSLLGEHSVERLLSALPRLLTTGGCLLVQTLHPLLACADQPYSDGWREGSWTGFSAAFQDPAPWYFRTLESWVRLFHRHGLHLCELREPLDALSGQPASVIFRVTV